jgi:hypothetical protein
MFSWRFVPEIGTQAGVRACRRDRPTLSPKLRVKGSRAQAVITNIIISADPDLNLPTHPLTAQSFIRARCYGWKVHEEDRE